MKKLLFLIIPTVLLGCDDGDIITNDFDFEDASVETCEPTASSSNTNNFVFYKNEDTNFESLVLQILTSDDILNVNDEYGPYEITGSNSFEYRKFNAAPGNDYYCNSIPPSTPTVTEVFNAIGGDIYIETSTRSDDDNDGILSEDEGIEYDLNGNIDFLASRDSDEDGIPNFIDIDDDGDNVPTRQEGVAFNSDGTIDMANSTDTDADGTPDYMDEDDDDDGVLTRNESIDGNLNPTDDFAIGATEPNYKVFSSTPAEASPLIEEYIPHTIERITQLHITIAGLTLTNGNVEIIEDDYDFGNYRTDAIILTCTPAFPGTMGSGVCIFQ
ncbi:hypothetical protein [uncultured Nonlabens sp.]|uniref:hypothetical protein n=1 Tax=uncultured Nonlabens sp. TaxID=859306 RepID=UPI002622CBF3|nr:hypothetical protein [uncultured Nonlabens sp.]